MRKSFLLFTFLVFLAGCFYQNDIGKPCNGTCLTIKGKVTAEENPVVPVAGVQYELNYYGPPTGIGGGALRRKIAKGHTDEQGNYEIVFASRDIELQEGHYGFHYWKDGYIMLEKNVQQAYNDVRFYAIRRPDTTLVQDIHMSVATSVSIDLDNFILANPQEDYAYIQGCYATTGPSQSFGLCPLLVLDPAQGAHQQLKMELAGNQTNILQFYGKKNGIRFERTDTLFLRKGANSVFHFSY